VPHICLSKFAFPVGSLAQFPVTTLHLWVQTCTNLYRKIHCKCPGLFIVFHHSSELLYDWGFTAVSLSWRQSLETHDQYFCFKLNTCAYSPYATSCLPREWVCRLQLLLVLASAVILRYESRRIHNHILLSQIRDPPTRRVRSPY
jgi:hypothetical protein